MTRSGKFRAARKTAKRSRSEAKPSEAWAPAKAGRRAKAIGWALVALLCVLIAGCGHYGPPVHPDTGTAADEGDHDDHKHDSKPSMKERSDAP
jgi:predicted small lipoprotein YifL